MLAPAERMKKMRDRRRKRGLRELRLVFLGARMAQTATHIAFEQTDRVASVRFCFFFAQVLCMVVMGARVALFAAKYVPAAVLFAG